MEETTTAPITNDLPNPTEPAGASAAVDTTPSQQPTDAGKDTGGIKKGATANHFARQREKERERQNQQAPTQPDPANTEVENSRQEGAPDANANAPVEAPTNGRAPEVTPGTGTDNKGAGVADEAKAELEKIRKERDELAERIAKAEAKEQEERANRLTQEQQKYLAKLQSSLADLTEEGLEIQADMEAAQAEGDLEAYNRLNRKYNRVYTAAENLTETYNGFLANAQATYHQTRMTQQEKLISGLLKEAGVTMDEMKEANPKLDITKPAQVMTAIAKAKDKKYTARIAELEKAAAEAKVQARQEWDATAPAARPTNTTGTPGTGSAPTAVKFGAGNSNALLAKAFKGK